MTLRATERANDEILQAIFRYGAKSAERVESFLGQYRAALRRIEANPRTYPAERNRGNRDIRSISIDKFPFSLIYEVREEEIAVIALWHRHSRSEDWSRRET